MSNQRPSDDGRASALGISGWPLGRKVALALAIPLLLAATLGGLRVQSDLAESSNSSASAQQVTVLRPAVDYLVAAERAMVAAQSSTGAGQLELEKAVEDIKAAAEELQDTAGTADLTFEQRLQVATLLDLSRSIRDDNTATLSPDTWIAQLRQLQSSTTKLITTITSAQNTPEPRLELLAQALGGRFSLAMQQALGADEDRSRSVSQALYSELGAESAAIDRLAGALDEAESAVRTLRTNNAARTRAVRTGASTVLGGSDAYDEYDTLAESLLLQVDQALATTATNARERALFDAAVTLAALFAAIALALVISRSLLGPIRRVREGALQVANEELPEAVARIRSGGEPAEIVPIDVHTEEEIGQLARAVDDLHRQAVTLASGEAKLRTQVGEMFVTLSRRNTTLINQQLNLIETLERDEEDPKRLESLFRLDHLASRMRRTADSLLILADAPTRSTGWESLTVTEATQAATAGVQDYQRVRIGSTLDSRIVEAAAGDLIHLLTELVDNALSYSSPSTDVTLDAAPAAGGLTIDVTDSGLGIPEESLRQINETLASGADVTPDTARRMGLFVVSRLAKRHGIEVALATNAASGITATVFVPESVLTDGAPAMPEAPAEAEVVESDEVPQAPFVPAIVTDDSPDTTSEVPSEDADEDDGDEAATSTPTATVIGLPTRQPGSTIASRESATGLPSREPGSTLPSRDAGSTLPSGDTATGLPSRQPGSTLAQRGLATGLDAVSDVPSARNTAAPTPKRGAMPLRSRRAALTETPAADGATEEKAASLEATEAASETGPEAPESVTPLAPVTTPAETPDEPAAETPVEPAAETAEVEDTPVGVEAESPEATEDVDDQPAAEATPEPELPAAASMAPVSTLITDPLFDPLTDPLPEEPEAEAPVAPAAPVAPVAPAPGPTGLPTRTRGGTLSDQEKATSPFRDGPSSAPEVPAASEAPEQPAAPAAPAALAGGPASGLASGLAGGLGGLPTRTRGGTLSDQEAATRPFRDSEPEPVEATATVTAEAEAEAEPETGPEPETQPEVVEHETEPAAVESDTVVPETPAALDDAGSAPGSTSGGLAGLPTRRRGGTLADQADATSPFRESTIEAPAAPTPVAPAALAGVAGPTGPGGGLGALPTRQRGGTLSEQDEVNRPFRDGGLGTRTAEVTSLTERREHTAAPAEVPDPAPVARTEAATARPQVGRASSLTRFRPASASRRASYEAAGGGPQQPLRTPATGPTTGSTTGQGSRTALDGDVRVEPDAEDTGSIFGSMRSSWLTSEGGGSGWQSAEVEAGWQRAEQVAESAKEAPSIGGGLPIRRPGTLLVPGGITKPTTVAPRDPEAIRARYAAYAAGVSRGRKTSTHTTDDRTNEQERK